MKIIYLDRVDSTHKYLKEYIKKNSYNEFTAVITNMQTEGIGSRNNKWVGKKGNLFFSFVMHKDSLPLDLPVNSMSIYFSYLFKEVLEKHGSKVWIKWPNDFYINNKKIGGTITNFNGKLIYCGIGLNLLDFEKDFGCLDIEFKQEKYLNQYFSSISAKHTWKQIFSKYSIEFNKSRIFTATVDNKKISLQNAVLNEDGSISLDNKKVFSLR